MKYNKHDNVKDLAEEIEKELVPVFDVKCKIIICICIVFKKMLIILLQ